MYNKKSVKDLTKNDLIGKRVLVRVDFNVPVDKETGVITDTKRITASLPTLKYLLENQAKLIIMTHFGRPKGEKNPKYKLDIIGEKLAELIGQPVQKLNDCIGSEVEAKVNALQNGEIILLENVRFYKEEEANNIEFAQKLAKLGDLYINDAFGTAHRAHASTEGVAHYLPAYAGLLINKELEIMGKALANPEHPFVAIIGGAKVSSKITVLENLIGKVDTLIVAGGMAYTFFKAMGKEVGKSLCEPDYLEEARKVMAAAEKSTTRIMLPVDILVADDFSETANTNVVDIDSIPADWEGVDIGPKTIENFSAVVKEAKTVVWNGPMGVFEINKFAAGTNAIAKVLAESDNVSIIGGGDSASATEKSGYADKITHISTGGGASLEFLEGKILPGIAILQDK